MSTYTDKMYTDNDDIMDKYKGIEDEKISELRNNTAPLSPMPDSITQIAKLLVPELSDDKDDYTLMFPIHKVGTRSDQ